MIGDSRFPNPTYTVCAPTQGQVKKIYWHDFKTMIPPELILGRPNETELFINLITGARIELAGLDNPARIEGSPKNGFLFDEVDDVKRSAWAEHVFPCFADRKAWAMFVGVPNGIDYLYDLSKKSLKHPETWDFFTWKSSEVLDPAEIAMFKSMMDERTFKQEFEASFETFGGLVAYNFSRDNYKYELTHDIHKPLAFCFDFNTSPGIAGVCQEQVMPNQFEQVKTSGGVWVNRQVVGTGVIGEVHIPRNSNTLIVCERLYNDWKDHKGKVICYGDAAGGNKTASAISGSDWDLIRNYFKQTPFANRIEYRVPRANPRVRARINSINSRCKAIDGTIRLMVDPTSAPKFIDDMEKLTLLEGGSGEIDKNKNPDIGHLFDAISYHIHTDHPLDDMNAATMREF